MEYTVLEVAKRLIKRIQKTESYDKWITFIEDRPFNDQRYYISNQKLKDLGWDIDIAFEKGLEDLVSYYETCKEMNSITNLSTDPLLKACIFNFDKNCI